MRTVISDLCYLCVGMTSVMALLLVGSVAVAIWGEVVQRRHRGDRD
jgi:hypothetical protein